MICRIVRWEAARYLAIGGFVALTNNILLIGGDRLGIAYPVLAVVVWIVGGSLGFLLHSHFTFRSAPNHRSYAQFMAGTAIGIPLTIAMLALFVSWWRMPMRLAGPTATLAMFLYNYLNARLAILLRWRVGRPRQTMEE